MYKEPEAEVSVGGKLTLLTGEKCTETGVYFRVDESIEQAEYWQGLDSTDLTSSVLVLLNSILTLDTANEDQTHVLCRSLLTPGHAETSWDKCLWHPSGLWYVKLDGINSKLLTCPAIPPLIRNNVRCYDETGLDVRSTFCFRYGSYIGHIDWDPHLSGTITSITHCRFDDRSTSFMLHVGTSR